MIRFGDAAVLALTKLRARKVRTIFTIIIAGLLFGVVATIIFISDGALGSIEKLTKESMTGRYIVSGMAQSFFDPSPYYTDPELIQKALAEHKQLVADKKAEAKRLGIEYDASQDPSPVETVNGAQSLSYASTIATRLINEKLAEQKKGYKYGDFQAIAKAYAPKATYATTLLQPENGSLVEMKKGVESFTSEQKPTEQQMMMGGGSPDINEQQLVPEALVSNYIVSNNAWRPENGTIPVVVSQKRATSITGYAAPSKDAPADVRLSYINDLRTKALGQTFSVCYRNTVSTEQITQAVTVAKEIESHKNDKNYQKPALVYATPDPASCGAAVVPRDVRTKEEKDYTNKQMEFNRKFGQVVDPVQMKLTYEVIGVAPNTWADTDMSLGFGVKDMVMSIFMTNGFRMSIPQQMYNSMPNKATFAAALSEEPSEQQQSYGIEMFYAEFASADQARAFAKNESCQYGMSGCEPKEKHFNITPFGSNSIALDEMRKGITTTLLWVTAIATIIAAVIAGLTIGRTIADGRRETAVFRAIGFKRFDISQVYMAYTVMLSLLVALFALGVGLVVAMVAHHSLWLDTTLQAQLTLGVYDTKQTFSYVGITEKALLVVGAALLAGVIGMMLPLLRNVRRNPIRDMRDE